MALGTAALIDQCSDATSAVAGGANSLMTQANQNGQTINGLRDSLNEALDGAKGSPFGPNSPCAAAIQDLLNQLDDLYNEANALYIYASQLAQQAAAFDCTDTSPGNMGAASGLQQQLANLNAQEAAIQNQINQIVNEIQQLLDNCDSVVSDECGPGAYKVMVNDGDGWRLECTRRACPKGYQSIRSPDGRYQICTLPPALRFKPPAP